MSQPLCISFRQVDINTAIKMYGVHHVDFLQLIVASVVTIFLGPVYGILVSLGLSLCVIIYRTARPPVVVLGQLEGVCFVACVATGKLAKRGGGGAANLPIRLQGLGPPTTSSEQRLKSLKQ